MSEEGLFIERLDAQAEVVDIVPLLASRRPTLAPQRPVDSNQIDHRNTGAEVEHPKIVPALLEFATEHRGVERETALEVLHPQDDMVNTLNREVPHTGLVIRDVKGQAVVG